MTDSPIISVTGLVKRFGDFHALSEVNLSVRPGERLVICGPSGSGKSTLIRCLNGLERHDSGEVRVDGVVLQDRPPALLAVRRRVGMVFQQFNLFPHLTVLENCCLAPMRAHKLDKATARRQAEALLDRVHILDQAHKYPIQLSGGQQQRVAIARALCMSPAVLLFDEPTSALDPEMVGEVLEVMIELAQSGVTMLCVTHEMGFARRVADRVVFMDAGRIVEIAPPDTFFTQPQSERARTFIRQLLHDAPAS